ncbi:DNA-binding transcriptional regulator, LysR family [Amycolatopsis pretoriensis]|uniref:DNA-binding transcriptional regulator, LysR family n=1 Tax=Amycolatopsis pretoriensis TaxID=218821 RepID=A0A1H5Q8M4_9PSEU|nr:LysR family transcriptional regulator [Amycolatopsis pretoriensis]SEF21617.1 DNA-binding transcriptional regulator, LysR family [Amycolatopsis pretoriensis]
MDVQTLRLFREVAGGATVTETAARGHLTQPALSRALRRLEHDAGAELFRRSGRVLRLTPAGHAFRRHVEAVLDQLDQGLREVAEIVDPGTGVVPLAFLHTFGTWLVPSVLRSFLREHAGARFELRQHGEAGLETELLDGTADLVITSGDPGHAQLRWERLLVEPLRLAVPPHHRLAGRRRVRLADLADETFILLRPGYALRETTERLCAEAGFAPRIGFEGDEVETLRGLVTAGLGVSVLPLPHTATFPAPHLALTDVDAARDIGLAWAAGRTLPPLSETFRQHVLAADLDRPQGTM